MASGFLIQRRRFAIVFSAAPEAIVLRLMKWARSGPKRPFAAVPLNVGFSPTFLDLVTVLLVAVWAAQLASGRHREWVSTPLDLPLVLFLALAFFSFIVGLSYAGLTVMTFAPARSPAP